MSMSRGTDVERSTYVERGEPLSKLHAGFFFFGHRYRCALRFTAITLKASHKYSFLSVYRTTAYVDGNPSPPPQKPKKRASVNLSAAQP